MNKLKRTIVVVTVALFGSALTVPALAYAESGSDSTSGSSDSNSTESETQSHSETEMHARELTEKFKKQASENQVETRTRVKEKSAEARQKVCEVRKTNIEKRLAKRVERAKAHKEKFDKIFERVKAFHDEKTLVTPGYDALVTAVVTAQTDAEAQIVALEALNVDVDCTNSNVTEALGAFKEAVKSTKTSLKTYRTAIKNLIVAVHQSAEDSTTNQSNQ